MDPGRSDYRFDWRMSSSHHAQPATYQDERPQDMRTLLPFPAERVYKCGCCTSMFHMIWQLHEHVLLHATGGSYIYNHNIRTAFPKFEGVSQETQTDQFEDVRASKNVEVVCNSTQTEDNLSNYFMGRGDIDDPGEDDYKGDVEVKVEKTENDIVNDSSESEDDAFNDTIDKEDDNLEEDPYGGETDEDVSFLSVEESSSDVKDPEWNMVDVKKTKISQTFRTSKRKSKRKDNSEKSVRKKSKTGKVICKSKSKDGNDAANKPLIKCKYCDKLFRNNLHMKRHCVRDHPTEKNFPCRYCDEAFVTEAEVQRHRREHNKEKNRCQICNKILSSAQNLQDHITVHTGEKMFECKDCGNFFRSRSQLSLHASRRHNPNYDHMCENCGRVFKCRQNLQCHIKCCLDIRPFGCKICGKRYPRNTNLNVHMRKHTGEKPFVCHTCGMKFSHSNTLTKHMLVHTGERKFTCDVCGQKFKAHNALKDHERIHKQEKRFTCQYCGKGFIKKCNMVTHIRQHTGETPYKCNICGQAYKQNVLLRTHIQSHKTEIHPSSLPSQTADKYEPEASNPSAVAQNALPAPSNQLAPSYMINHQVTPNHSMSHLPLPSSDSTRNQGLNQTRNVPMHSQTSPQQRYQGYSMTGMH